MKRKGFTLIEVLAVIVILAIIALIATPIMLGVIENARRKAFEDTGYGVIEGVRAYYVEKLSEEGVVGEKMFTFPNSELKLSGTEPAGGNVKLYADGSIELAIHNNRWCATKAVNEDEVTTVDYVEGECKIPEPDSILMNNFMSRGNVTTDKTKITNIEFVGTKEVPSDALDSWDASEENNGSVIAYLYEDEENEGYYKLYLGGNEKVYAPEDSYALFADFKNVISINLALLDTSNVVYMDYMFSECRNLTGLNLSNFNTSNVIYMNYMFSECRSLTSLDVSNFDTKKVVTMNSMFHNVLKLSYLDLSSFNIENVKDVSYMFFACFGLENLNLSSFDFSEVEENEMVFDYVQSAIIQVKDVEAQTWVIEQNSQYFSTANVIIAS